ncbi:MAG: ketopantoate reductase family protein [Burkholderiales bacterium]
MRIYMIGAGAMGGVFGGLLCKAGADVTLIDPRREHIEKIRSEGLHLEGVRGTHQIRLPVHESGANLPPCDLAVVFTDANSTREAARAARSLLAADGFALTLQNGIGNVETLVEELGARRVIAGVSMNSAANPAPGRVAYTNSGMTSLGELDGQDTERVRNVMTLLNRAEIPAEIVADPMSWIWGKFVHNCSVNALAAITGLRGGEISRNAAVNALQDRVMEEIMMVVRKKGIRLPETDPIKKIKDHCRKRYNKPSMMQHIEQGRRTEIDALNGALLREGKALGLSLPLNEVIVAVVKGLEQSRAQLLHEPPRDYKKLEEAAARE